MTRREVGRTARLPTLARLAAKLGLGVVVFVLGCGGQVVVPDYDEPDDGSSEAGVGGSGGTGSSSGGSVPSLASGQCVKCDGRQECAFCLVHGYNSTYICPPGKDAPKSGCLSLGEIHTSSDGYDFACHYCN